MQINPYLFFDGSCEEAFKFYEQCFGGKIDQMINHEGTPAAEQVPPEWRKKILHARLTIGDQLIMGSDTPPDCLQKPQGFSVNLAIKTPEEAERMFKALAENGTVNMPL